MASSDSLSLRFQGVCFVPIYAAKVVMKNLRHLPMTSTGRCLVVHSVILAGSLTFTGDAIFTMACIYKGPLACGQQANIMTTHMVRYAYSSLLCRTLSHGLPLFLVIFVVKATIARASLNIRRLFVTNLFR